ncbi:hypothetical protein PR048_028263 [Dryococelus australis]|uniref:HAT C-terminal dimerisation domain-containing protein n=1 Tax=Dryococelus australis TaxID=614101 RepID=A0ABQ9GIR5_9NEOP|nr:hypothetical protein PR048_028263 [Dryococelus australis]
MQKKLSEKGKKKSEDRLMQLFTKDFQPFRIVEDEGCKEFVQALNPSYQLLSRHFISKTGIPALYEEYCRTSLNTDSYIGLTAHFVNENYELISVLLVFSVMRSANTSENVTAEIKRIVTDWGIDKKIVLAVSDNACNIKNAVSKDLSKTISGEKYCSASLLIPVANGLQNLCENLLKQAFSNSVTEVVVKLQAGLNTRLGYIENSSTLSICTFLDSRFKSLAFSSPSSSEHAKKLVTSAISSSLAEVIDSNSEYMGPTVVQANNQDDGELLVWQVFDRNAAAKKARGTPMSRALVEVQRYIDEDLLPRQCSPLIWWKENSQFFPHLSVLARNRLCALGTSVPRERLFSKAGLFLSERRSRLSENKTKMLLFLNSSLQWCK